MTESTDQQLLADFAKSRNPAAFEQLVRRHMDWVYSAARRQVRDAHLAQDVAQAVFILLAQKAPSLQKHAHLAGWLFRTTRYCAANALKQKNRRQFHEQEARAMQARTEEIETSQAAEWAQIQPLLDQSVTGLATPDRDAVLLRFYQGKSMAEIAAVMGTTEEAAKKRVQRALEKLRGMLVHNGVTLSSAGLAVTMAAKVTQAAPVGLIEATLAASAGAAKATLAGAIAQAAGKIMWWAKVKIAAMLAIAGITSGVTVAVIAHAAMPAAPKSGGAAPVPEVPIVAPATTPVVVAPVVSAADFDPLYEKAPGSGPGLRATIGPNTFAVTGVVRYAADGKPLATDGRGTPVDAAGLPVTELLSRPLYSNDVVLIFLSPAPDRYDIDRLRIFNHATRRYIRGLMITPVPGQSAIRIAARPGALPPQIDLWLATASYSATNMPINLAPQKEATATIGTATLHFEDLLDGSYNFSAGKFTLGGMDMPQTTMRLQATGKWNAGRYQFSAVSRSGQKYLSDFFINLAVEAEPIITIPFSLDQVDHFELRPFAHEPPFYFDGIALPDVGKLPAPAGGVSPPLIVDANNQSVVKLPSGAVVELAGIAHNPPGDQGWWGIDGKPTAVAEQQINGSVGDDNGRLKARIVVAHLLNPPAIAGGDRGILWQIDGASGWVGGGGLWEDHVLVAFRPDVPRTVRIGVAVTPWQIISEFTADQLTKPVELKDWPGMLYPPQATAEGLALTTTMNLPEATRMVVIDRDGKIRQSSVWSTYGDQDKVAPWGMGASSHMTYRGLRIEDFQSIRIEYRKEEYAEFKNIPLEPK